MEVFRVDMLQTQPPATASDFHLFLWVQAVRLSMFHSITNCHQLEHEQRPAGSQLTWLNPQIRAQWFRSHTALKYHYPVQRACGGSLEFKKKKN